MYIWDEVEELLEKYDTGIEFDCASLCAWGGELRLTLTNPPTAPSRSVTFHSTGGQTPEDVARRLLDDCNAWLAEPGRPEPLPAASG